MPIHAPRITVFGDLTPLLGRYVNRTPKRHILAWKDVIWRIDSKNRSTGATCAHAHETKKKDKERNLSVQWETGYSPRPPTSSNRNTVWRGGCLLAVVISFKFHQHQLSSYWAAMGQNLADFGWSHYLGQWLIRRPYSRMAMMKHDCYKTL